MAKSKKEFNLDSITEEDRRAINAEYALVDSALPRDCGCGRRYTTELDVIERTSRCGRVQDFTEEAETLNKLDLLYYFRNCLCSNTMPFQLEGEKAKKELAQHREYIKQRAEREQALFNHIIEKSPKEKQLMELSKTGDFLGYLFNQVPKGHKLQEFSQDPSSHEFSDADWRQIARDRFRDIKNDWIRHHQKLPKYRVLLVDSKNQDNAFLKDISLEDTEWVYSSRITEARDRFRENPEGLSVVIVDLSKNYNQRKDFIDYIRQHDGSQDDKQWRSKRYAGGENLSIIGLNGSENTKDLKIQKMIQKPYLMDDLTDAIKEQYNDDEGVKK